MTIAEILRMKSDERKEAFKAHNIEKVVIDGREFTGYSAFSFLWEKTYVKSPERSGDGSITNLNSYAYFITPHLKIDFSLLSIEDYRALMKLIYAKNEFTVECYDIVENGWTTNRMYFATEEMPKLWAVARAINGEEWVEVLGVEDYTVEMIGTNTSLETAYIVYHDRNGNHLYAQEVDAGTEALVSYTPDVIPSGYRFDGLWKTKEGAPYRNGEVVYVGDVINLYAEFVQTNQYTLSLDFGVGIEPTPQLSTKSVDSFTIMQAQTIGAAISKAGVVLADGSVFTFPENGTGTPEVEYNGKKHSGSAAYTFDGWYYSTTAVSNFKVSASTLFDKAKNATIHQIYKPRKWSVYFETNMQDVYVPSMRFKYGEAVDAPNLQSLEKTFVGWYWKDGDKEVSFNGVMPPFNLTLYAKWE